MMAVPSSCETSASAAAAPRERGAGVHFERLRPELAWKLGRFLASAGA
jgi:hypothetical protein